MCAGPRGKQMQMEISPEAVPGTAHRFLGSQAPAQHPGANCPKLGTFFLKVGEKDLSGTRTRISFLLELWIFLGRLLTLDIFPF